jgi:uncharacterized protein (DUF952 family)
MVQYLYKIVSPEEWGSSQGERHLVISAFDKAFIHLATEDQLSRIVEKFWNGKSYLVLKLDPQKLIGRLVHEANPGGTSKYYHLYDGSIPMDAVVDLVDGGE